MSKIISSVRPKAPVDDQFATRIDDGKSSEVLIWYGRVQPRRIFTYYYNSKKVARGSALEKNTFCTKSTIKTQKCQKWINKMKLLLWKRLNIAVASWYSAINKYSQHLNTQHYLLFFALAVCFESVLCYELFQGENSHHSQYFKEGSVFLINLVCNCGCGIVIFI